MDDMELRQRDVLHLLRQAQDRCNSPLKICFSDERHAKVFGQFIHPLRGYLTFEGELSRDEVLEEISAGECVEVVVRLNPGLESVSSGGGGVHLNRLASQLSLCAKSVQIIDESVVPATSAPSVPSQSFAAP